MARHTAGWPGPAPAAHSRQQSEPPYVMPNGPRHRPGGHTHDECAPARPAGRFGHDPGARVAVISAKCWTSKASMRRGSSTVLGVTGFVLRYRLPAKAGPIVPTCRCRMPSAPCGWCAPMPPNMRVDPARMGFMGFSAGGHLACSIATRFAAPVYAPVDTADTRGARGRILSVPMYPVVTMGEGRHAGSRDHCWARPRAAADRRLFLRAERDRRCDAALIAWRRTT